MVVGFTTTYAISAYQHWCCEFESRSGRGVQHYVIKFVSDLWQWWFSLGPPVSSTNKTDLHDITEILLKVASNTIKQRISLALWLYLRSVLYHITGNFCSFGLKRRHLIFVDFFSSVDWKSRHRKKKIVCITGSNNRSDVTIKKKNGAHYSDP